MTTSTTPKPAAKFRDGNIIATIWENHGKHGVFYTTTLARSYKDGETYKEINSYSGVELLKAQRLAGVAYDKERDLMEAARISKATA